MQLLQLLRHNSIVDDDGFYGALAKLVRHRYDHVPLSADAMLWVLRRSPSSTDPAVQGPFDQISTPSIDPIGATRVTAAAFVRLYREDANQIRRGQMLERALVALGRRLERRVVADLFLAVLPPMGDAAAAALQRDVTEWAARQPLT